MRLINILQISLVPLAWMAYGWYLGQLHQSGYDLAGILLFFTGVVGFMVALLIHRFTRKFSWHGKWFTDILIGGISCSIVFGFVFLYARLHG